MNDRSISDMFVNILCSVNDGRLYGFPLNDRLNRFMDMMMSQMLSICASFDGGTFSGKNSLLILNSSVHFLMTRGVFIGHSLFMMTMFGSELFMFMFGVKSSFFLDGLSSVLMMVNFMFASDVLVNFLGFGRSDGVVSCLRFHFRVDCGIMVFTRGKDLLSEQFQAKINHVLDFIHCRKID